MRSSTGSAGASLNRLEESSDTAVSAGRTTTMERPNNNNNTADAGAGVVGGGLPWINFAAYILNVAVTYGIGVGGLWNLPSNSELSAKYQTIVTPIGWAFAIWSIIFFSQAIWCGMQVASSFCCRLSDRSIRSIRTVHWQYAFVCASQVAWTLCFANEQIVAAAIAMVCILFNLGVIVFALSDSRNKFNNDNEDDEPSSSFSLSSIGHYFWMEFPFAIHCGWILAATVVNINVVLVSRGDAVSPAILFYSAVGGLVVLVGLALWLACARNFVTVPLVVTWALFGVYSELATPKDSIVATFSESQISAVRVGAVAAMTLLALSLTIAGVRAVWHASRSARRSEESVYLRANEM